MNPTLPDPTRRWLGLLLLALAVGLGLGLNSWGVLETSEARYAEIGREMLASHDWLHPRLLGIQHFHKPPLTYWLTAVGLALAGPTAAGARLLPVLAVLAQVALVYGLGRLLFEGDGRRALAAAALYGTWPVVLASALNLTTDAFLTTLELAATYALLRYYAGQRPGWLYGFWLALGLAFLTKGPVGLLLPLLVMVGFYFRRGQPRRPLTRHHALGAALFAAVGLSWYLYLVAENPAFSRYFLFQHTVERFSNPEAFGRSKPWWFYLVLVPATSLPWSAALVAQALRTPWATVPQAWRNVLIFWVLLPLLFFSLSGSKLLLYVLPVFAGLALLVVYYLGRAAEATRARWYRGVGMLYGGLLLALALLPVAGRPLGLAASPAVAAVALVGVGLVVLQHVRWRPATVAPRLLLVPLVFTGCLLLAAKLVLHQNEARFRSARPLAARLRRPDLAGRPVLVYDELLPALAFELGQVPVSLYDGNASLRRETQFEPGRAWQQQLLNLPDSSAARLLAAVQARPDAVLVVVGPLPARRQGLRAGRPHEEQLGPWRIYYAP